MKVTPTKLPEVLLVEPDVFGDSRGFFCETWSRRRYAEHGIDVDFVQDNVSRSQYGVLRGMHLQHPHGQGKLVTVLVGEVFDVAIDVRPDSPRFGQWVGMTLSAENHRQLYIPPGFAHGFCVTGEEALFSYKCTDFYSRQDELGVRWDDPQVGIAWPIRDPQLSDKDKAYPTLAEIPPAALPPYAAARDAR